MDISPPVRAVKTVARLLGLDLELRDLDLMGGEQFSEAFLKMNPEHTLPTIDDNGFIIWDSHAICAYLVDKYADDDSLYPKDSQLRAKCNQRLFLDAASLFVRLRDIGNPIVFGGGTEVPQEKLDAVTTVFEILETFLATDPFLVGENLTIADICCSMTVPFLGTYVPITTTEFSKIEAWLERIRKTIPFFDEMNAWCAPTYQETIFGMLEKNKLNK